jgi:hypothetical protein
MSAVSVLEQNAETMSSRTKMPNKALRGNSPLKETEPPPLGLNQ